MFVRTSIMSLVVVIVSLFNLCSSAICDANAVNCSDGFPVIDLIGFLNADAETQRSIADVVDSAMQHTGFFYLVNHGIDHSAITAFYDANQKFFASPIENKMKFHGAFGAGGFSPNGTQKFNINNGIETETQNKKSDLVESFEIRNMGHDWLLTAPSMDDLPSQFTANDAARNYMRDVRSVLSKLNFLASTALELEENEFEKQMLCNPGKSNFASLRTNYYFPLGDRDRSELSARAFGIGPHTDFMGFTLLYTDNVPGLQAKVNGTWVDVPARATEDAFIVNAGDLIKVWTHNRWKAAEHRVVRNVEDSRLSIAYFSGPSFETLVEPFRGCAKCSITAGEHVRIKMKDATARGSTYSYGGDAHESQ